MSLFSENNAAHFINNEGGIKHYVHGNLTEGDKKAVFCVWFYLFREGKVFGSLDWRGLKSGLVHG